MRFPALAALGLTVIASAQGPPTPSVVAEIGTFTEGPVFDEAGNLFVSHQGSISMIAPDGTATEWARPGHANGHKILANGEHLVAGGSVVLRLAADGQVLGEAASDCGGQPIRTTNDLTLDTHSGFYFTDPGDISAGAMEDEQGKVCYVDADGTTQLVAEGLGFPNGIVLRPDGQTLLVGETTWNRVLAIPISVPGTGETPAVFAELPARNEGTLTGPDGMALDEDGNLYVAHFGTGQIRVFDTDGRLTRSLPAGNGAVTNVAFGGGDRDKLFITGTKELGGNHPGVVYQLSLPGVRGLPTR